MTFFPTVLAIGLGATIGASMRYYLTQFMNATFGNTLPYGTLSANVIGVLILTAKQIPSQYNTQTCCQ
jgi:CrcB protein